MGAILISFAPVFVKLLDRTGMGPTTIGFWRTTLGGLTLFAISAVWRRSLKISPRMFAFSIALGALFALDLFVWHKSILIVGAGMATILGNTQVFWTSVLGRAIWRERLTAIFKVAAPLGLIGLILLTGVGSEIEFTARYGLGVFFGLATGCVYAVYLITLKTSSQPSKGPHNHEKTISGAGAGETKPFDLREAIVSLGWISIFSGFFMGLGSLLEGESILPSSIGALGLVYSLALVAQVGGWLAIYVSLSKLPASLSALALLLQPTFATLWGAILFAEEMTALQFFGGAITLAAIYLGASRGTR